MLSVPISILSGILDGSSIRTRLSMISFENGRHWPTRSTFYKTCKFVKQLTRKITERVHTPVQLLNQSLLTESRVNSVANERHIWHVTYSEIYFLCAQLDCSYMSTSQDMSGQVYYLRRDSMYRGTNFPLMTSRCMPSIAPSVPYRRKLTWDCKQWKRFNIWNTNSAVMKSNTCWGGRPICVQMVW